jgi:O-6-methylguanine DNA methyltransferase
MLNRFVDGNDDGATDSPVSSLSDRELEIVNLIGDELARRAGQPAAARAVGGLMARNPLPIILPCHRVIAATGALTGYSGGAGIATKIFLLNHEKAS